jgi:dienelactone hydrolase
LNLMMYKLMALTALLATAGAATSRAQVAVNDFSAGQGNGLYSFASTTPATVVDLINRQRPRPAATITGELLLPAGAAKVPVVVLMHGSGGVYPELASFWAKHFNDAGIAAFIVDVFGPRGVRSTVEDQGQVPFAADTADAFAALGLLATHPRIDARRVAVMGFSRGAMTAIRSAAVRIADGAAAAPGQRFAAHIGVYSGGRAGGLAVTAKPGVFGGAPMLFLHGDADDYAYASDCRAYADRLRASGTAVDFVLLPGARHKFDADNPQRIYLRAAVKTREGCPLEFDLQDMAYRDRRSGEPLPFDRGQAMLRGELCTDRGASVEGDRKARDAAAAAVLDFLTKHLKS